MTLKKQQKEEYIPFRPKIILAERSRKEGHVIITRVEWYPQVFWGGLVFTAHMSMRSMESATLVARNAAARGLLGVKGWYMSVNADVGA